ncbi:hypothetical protein, partial [Klebsiella pneumoniae]|uniref:hypothetical protein n=1 Tax=Klebsiella pneumoniae TaxID=573 RepID=UPI0013C2DFCD
INAKRNGAKIIVCDPRKIETARIVVWISPPLYWHYLCYRRAASGPKIAHAAQYRLDETGSFTPWQTNRNR